MTHDRHDLGRWDRRLGLVSPERLVRPNGNRSAARVLTAEIDITVDVRVDVGVQVDVRVEVGVAIGLGLHANGIDDRSEEILGQIAPQAEPVPAGSTRRRRGMHRCKHKR